MSDCDEIRYSDKRIRWLVLLVLFKKWCECEFDYPIMYVILVRLLMHVNLLCSHMRKEEELSVIKAKYIFQIIFQTV